MQNKVRLEIVDGPLKGKKFEFAEHDTFVFGRAPDCHAHLPDDTPPFYSRGAARILSLHPNTLRFRMQKLGIVRPHRAR